MVMDLSFFWEVLLVAILVAYSVCSSVNENSYHQATDTGIPGHLKPLGFHRKHEEPGVSVLSKSPHPRDFFKKFVQYGRPFLVPGLAEKMPMYQLWNDEYLMSKYGDIAVDIEVGKKENRSQEMIETSFKNFLLYYKNSDIYLVTSVPDVMRDEVWLPRNLLCGGFTRYLQDVVMWFSSGGTKSVLHFDGLDNMNCLLDGEKEVFMVDKDVDLAFDKAPSYSGVDVDKVDMYKYPQFRDVPWYNVTMKKGDCLFIPYRWPHQVRSSGRNLAINIWFIHMSQFDDKDCEVKGNIPEFAPLSDYTLISGEAEQFRYEIASYLKDKAPSNQISFQDVPLLCLFIGFLQDCEFEEVFQFFDKDMNSYVTYDEVIDANPEYWADLFGQLMHQMDSKEEAMDEEEEEAMDEEEEDSRLGNLEERLRAHEAKHTEL